MPDQFVTGVIAGAVGATFREGRSAAKDAEDANAARAATEERRYGFIFTSSDQVT